MFRKGRELEGAPDEESKCEAGFDDDGRLERDPESDMIVGRKEGPVARPPGRPLTET